MIELSKIAALRRQRNRPTQKFPVRITLLEFCAATVTISAVRDFVPMNEQIKDILPPEFAR